MVVEPHTAHQLTAPSMEFHVFTYYPAVFLETMIKPDATVAEGALQQYVLLDKIIQYEISERRMEERRSRFYNDGQHKKGNQSRVLHLSMSSGHELTQ